jgi:hypothetical protein
VGVRVYGYNSAAATCTGCGIAAGDNRKSTTSTTAAIIPNLVAATVPNLVTASASTIKIYSIDERTSKLKVAGTITFLETLKTTAKTSDWNNKYCGTVETAVVIHYLLHSLAIQD